MIPSLVHRVHIVPLDDIFFHTEDSARMWKFVVNRFIVVEKELSEQTQDNIEIMDLLVKAIWLEQYWILVR